MATMFASKTAPIAIVVMMSTGTMGTSTAWIWSANWFHRSVRARRPGAWFGLRFAIDRPLPQELVEKLIAVPLRQAFQSRNGLTTRRQP